MGLTRPPEPALQPARWIRNESLAWVHARRHGKGTGHSMIQTPDYGPHPRTIVLLRPRLVKVAIAPVIRGWVILRNIFTGSGLATNPSSSEIRWDVPKQRWQLAISSTNWLAVLTLIPPLQHLR